MFINESINDLKSRNEYEKILILITLKNEIKLISVIEKNIDRAKIYEEQGDFYEDYYKNANPYYSNSFYIKALKEIKDVKYPELKARLEIKIKENNLRFIEYLRSHYSLNSEIEELMNKNTIEIIEKYKICDFNSGLCFLLSLTDSFKIETPSIDTSNFLNSYFINSKINNKGNVISNQEYNDFNKSLDRKIMRSFLIHLIYNIKIIMDKDYLISMEKIEKDIIRLNSRFIPKDRLTFFIQGLYQGFNNNFVVAAHILIPQIENSLKHILNLKNICTTNYYEEIQEDNMLGGLIEKIINSPISKKDFLIELKDFLVEKNGENFRNSLCHGLLSENEIFGNSIYLWLLALLMVYNSDQIFF